MIGNGKNLRRNIIWNKGVRMSEKRFHQFGLWVIDNPNFDGISIADLVDTELMSITEVVDKLNEQDKEIDLLRLELNDCEKFRYTVFKRMGELNDE